MSLVETKSVLAKLLAAENINIQHSNVPTACFDLKSRTLTCPTLVDMDGAIYDLFMGHEVGHALETPAEGWHNAPVTGKKNFRSYLNVIEDARIEKKIKRRYPGLSRSFNSAYKQLFDRDFFGVKMLPNTDKLMLIDRINLRCKVGAHVIVQFNDEERVLLRETENSETWEQVVDIAERVYAYSMANEQDKISNLQDLKDAIKDAMKDAIGEDDYDDEDDTGDSDDASDTEYDDVDSGEEASSEDASDDATGDEGDEGDGFDDSDEDPSDTESDGFSDGAGDTDEDEGPESVTDSNFRERESELVNESGVVNMMHLPEPIMDKIIKKNADVLEDFEEALKKTLSDNHNVYARNGVTYDMLSKLAISKFNKNNKKYITHILKEFEMRKRATEYARTQTARTGELEMNVLHKYKFSNDLFKKISIVPKGKNHGMILFLDMSGSMANIFRNTVEQLLVLVSFCKMANIPFEVYGFSNYSHSKNGPRGLNSYNFEKFTQNVDEFGVRGESFHLLHLIGSGMSKNTYSRSFSMLSIIVNEYGVDGQSRIYYSTWYQAGFGMNSTPTIETLLVSRKIITDFRIATKADIVNVVYLTDGVGDNTWNVPKNSGGYTTKSVYYIIDKKTKTKKRLMGYGRMQETLTELVREVTGCKHIGFYLTPRNRLIRELKYSSLSIETLTKLRDSAKKNNFFTMQTLGYDNYFYVGIDGGNVDDGKLAVDTKMTKAKMAAEFKKHQRGKSANRILVSRFSQEIAA